MKASFATRPARLFSVAAAPVLAGCALLLLGCSKVPDTTEAVRQGIVRDLTKKVDINNMDVNVSSVSFRGNQADATVAFSPKGQPASGMLMKYTLEKKDDGWHILRRQADAAAHGGGIGEQQPGMEGHPPLGGQPGLSTQPGEGGQRELPANHPPIGGNTSGGSGSGSAPPLREP